MTELPRLNSFSEWCLPPLCNAWFLTGPTASGKSEVSLDLANQLNAEIVSMDSMAIYRDMDIGTAKPSAEDRQFVAHHMIDVVSPADDYSLSQYVVTAHEIARNIRERGKTVLFVGGTPLYLKSLLRGMFLGPPPDEQFRSEIEEDVSRYGLEPLRQRLQAVDPLSAYKILPNDKRRMIRALEVARATGFPMSHWQTQFERMSRDRNQQVFALGWQRGDLHQRVERRVQKMLDKGLVDEVKSLLEKYRNLSKTAMQAVGYKEPIAYLQGELTEQAMAEQITFHTRQFVRRQEMWLRSLDEVERYDIVSESDLSKAAVCMAKRARMAS